MLMMTYAMLFLSTLVCRRPLVDQWAVVPRTNAVLTL